MRASLQDLQPEIQVTVGAIKNVSFTRLQPQLKTDGRVVLSGSGDLEVVNPPAIDIVNNVQLTGGLSVGGALGLPIGK